MRNGVATPTERRTKIVYVNTKPSTYYSNETGEQRFAAQSALYIVYQTQSYSEWRVFRFRSLILMKDLL